MAESVHSHGRVCSLLQVSSGEGLNEGPPQQLTPTPQVLHCLLAHLRQASPLLTHGFGK